MHEASSFSTVSLALAICCLFDDSHFTGVGCYLFTVLIDSSPMLSDVEHLFMCLLANLYVFFGKVSISGPSYVSVGSVFLTVSCVSSLYILDISILPACGLSPWGWRS